MYSCGYFESAADALEQAQTQKVDRICRALRLVPSDHVLEIGSGWGGFAVWAATRYGCRVTTTTISDEQYRHVCEWRSRIGEAGLAHRGVAGRLPGADRTVRQGGQHRDVRGGRPQALRRLFLGGRPPARSGWRDVPADDYRGRSVVPQVPRHTGLDREVHLSGRRTRLGGRDAEVARADARRSRSITPRIAAPITHAPCGPGAPGSTGTSRACAPSGSTTGSSACGTCIWDRAKRRFSNDTPGCSSCCW